MKKTLIILFSLTCIGFTECKNKGTKESIENKLIIDNKEFQSFVNQLPQIETPLTFNSKKNKQIESAEIKENPFSTKLREEDGCFNILGKLFETKNYIAILGIVPADMAIPVIFTLDKNGNKIDKYFVFKNAQGDMGFYTWNIGTIFPDKQIQFIDSTITRKINPEGTNEIPGTDSLSVVTNKYQISEDGKFIEIK